MLADARSDYFVFILPEHMVIFPVTSLHSWILSIGMFLILFVSLITAFFTTFSHAFGVFLILIRKPIRLRLSLLRQLSRHPPSVAQDIFPLCQSSFHTAHTGWGLYIVCNTTERLYSRFNIYLCICLKQGSKKPPLSWSWVPVLNILGYLCLLCGGEASQAVSSVKECLLKAQLTCVSWMNPSLNCSSNSTSQDPLMTPPVQECHCDVPLYWMRQAGALTACSFHGFHSSCSIPTWQLNGDMEMKLTWFWYEQLYTGVDLRCKKFKRDYSKHI